MDYLTQYYKNMSEQLQEQISLLENQINEVYARNPELQFQQGEFAVVKRHGGSASTEDPTPSGAGTKRLLQMLHLHTALNHPKILPHEGVAIQRLLDDMAKSKPGDTFVGKETPEEKERKRVTDSIYSGISKQRRGQGISYHPNDWEGQDAEFRRAQNASDIQWTTGAGRAREAESSVILRTALGAVKRLSGTEEFQTSLKKLQDHIDKKAADEALGGDSPEHYYAGRLSREQDEKFEDARFNKAQEHVLGFSGKQRPTKINEESESNKRELERINQDRKAEGKPPFRTLDQALTHYEKEDERARRKKYGK